MSEPADSDLYNAVAGTMHLLECAKDWERLARDESLDDETRVESALRARAIREEIRPS